MKISGIIFLIALVPAALDVASAQREPSARTSPADRQATLEKRKAELLRDLTSMGIGNPTVLKAISEVRREEFIPRDLWSRAYDNTPLPIGNRQTISQPYIVAFMTEALRLRPGEKVLEIGTGSGYQAAVLAEVGAEVYSIEIIAELARRARRTLRAAGYDSIKIKTGDGNFGWPEHAPFDAVILTAAAPTIPPKLIEQLKVGGRMLLPVGSANQELVLVTKKEGGNLERRRLLPVRFVPLTGETGN